MFGFFGRKKETQPAKETATADTFVEATGGGWGDPPEVVSMSEGEQLDYVNGQLKQAKQKAVDEDVPVGGQFVYTLSGIPANIDSPHQIVLSMMVCSYDHGLEFASCSNETVSFIRLR